MVSEETTKECSGVDLSYQKTLIHKEANSRGSSDENESNSMLLTLAVRQGQCRIARWSYWRETPESNEPSAVTMNGVHRRC